MAAADKAGTGPLEDCRLPQVGDRGRYTDLQPRMEGAAAGMVPKDSGSSLFNGEN